MPARVSNRGRSHDRAARPGTLRGAYLWCFAKPPPRHRELAAANGNSAGHAGRSLGVAFQPDRGAPAKIALEKLSSWSESADTGVKYFSGTAIYTKTFEAARRLVPVRRAAVAGPGRGEEHRGGIHQTVCPLAAWLEGAVSRLKRRATGSRRTKQLGNQGDQPLGQSGLIGDQQPGIAKKYTYTTQPFYRADSPLLPSASGVAYRGRRTVSRPVAQVRAGHSPTHRIVTDPALTSLSGGERLLALMYLTIH